MRKRPSHLPTLVVAIRVTDLPAPLSRPRQMSSPGAKPMSSPLSVSRDSNDARDDRLAPLGDLRVVAGDDHPPGPGQGADPLERLEPLGHGGDDLDALARRHRAVG